MTTLSDKKIYLRKKDFLFQRDCYTFAFHQIVTIMFWKTKAPVQQQEEIQLVTDQVKRYEDRIVLEHIIEYIKVLSRESQAGFNYSANKLEGLLAQIPNNSSDIAQAIQQQIDMLRHFSDRMEYIDAHKIKPWDEIKYRNFIMQFCPKTNDDDDE